MDRDALERSLARRLIDHIDNRTTDMAEGVLEVPTDVYLGEHHAREVEALFLGYPLVLALSGALPEPETYRTEARPPAPTSTTPSARLRTSAPC